MSAVESRSVVGGVDLLAEARRLWKLPYLQQQRHGGGPLPTIEFRRSRTRNHTSGHCWGNGSRARIVITAGASDDPSEPLGVVLHELVHAVLPSSVHHEKRYWTTLQCAARDAWPDAPFRFNEPATAGWQRQRQITMGLRGLGLLPSAQAQRVPATGLRVQRQGTGRPQPQPSPG